MDLVSTSKRSPGSTRWVGDLCAQSSVIDTSDTAPDEVEAACCKARLDRIQPCTSRSFTTCPSPYDTIELAPPDPDHFVMHTSPRDRFHVCPILRVNPICDLWRLLCVLPKQA